MEWLLEIRRAARAEFDESADWYRDRNPEVRDRFVAAVDAVISVVVERPLTFPVVFGSSVRRAVVPNFPFSVFFRVDDLLIVVLSIFHDSRNPMIWRGRAE